jgi:hypothetical protein
MRKSCRIRPRLLLAAALGLAFFSGSALAADETSSSESSGSDSSDIDSLFTQPTAAAAATSDSGSLLSQYHAKQDKLSYSFDLYAGGGYFAGYTTPSTYQAGLTLAEAGDYEGAAAGLEHNPVGGFILTTSLDLRPVDYLRVHGSFALTYPTTTNTTMDFGWSLSELFLDYATKDALSVRFGKYSVTWGNARILGVADIPGRSVSTVNLASSVTVLPSWLTATKPAIWIKAALPLGPVSFTGLAGLPTESGSGLSDAGYGLLTEWVGGKTCLGLSGFYQNGHTPRAALTLKSSLWGVDLFVDSTAAWAQADDVLFDLDTGFYYRTSSGPDVTVTAELQWNGENLPGQGKLVADAVDIGGLSSAFALSWGGICGSPFTLGGTWYHDLSDGSGALIPSIGFDLASSVTVRLVCPFAYGADDSEYITNLPDETGGYAAGIGLVVLLKTSF